jgi:1-acyl-sn-glycerol-3-phosphate acyltransferase
MPTGGGKKHAPARPRKAKAAPAPRQVLGNDPFERGAAVREPVAPTRSATPPASAIPPTVTPTPTATPSAPRAASRLRDLALEEASGKHARDLARLLHTLWPAVRGRLGALASLRHLLEAPSADDLSLDADAIARAAPVLDLLVDAWWRVDVRGVEKLPPGGAIVVANHGGRFHWDALVLGHVLRRAGRECRSLLDEPALGTPIAGRIARRLGAVPATPANARALLHAGKLAAVFPEGSRNGERPWAERYRISRFGRGGFAHIALDAGAPVVPCAIVGSEETAAPFARPGWLADALGLPLLAAAPGLPLGPLASLPLPSRWSVRLGDPIAPERGASPDDAAAVNRLAERTRDTLQRMLDEDVASRRSVYL